MAGIGHNSNWDPVGYRGKLTAWRKARESLVEARMPIEVVRRRVARAKELGIDYKAYASLRAATGQDVVALLFSSNALRMMKEAKLPTDRAAKLADVAATRAVLVHKPLNALEAAVLAQIDTAADAPAFTLSWQEMAVHLRSNLKEMNIRPSSAVFVGDNSFEEEWWVAARAAGYIPASRYFAKDAH